MGQSFSDQSREHLLIRALDEDRAARQATDDLSRRAHEALAQRYRDEVARLGGVPRLR